MRVHRILMATDFSEEADRALTEADGLAQRLGAELILLHVSEPTPHHASEEGSRAARDALADRQSRIAGAGSRVSQVVVSGRAVEEICGAAVRLNADLVVLGTRGRTGLPRLLLGSVAEGVARNCERAVLVARSGASSRGYQSILAATDFSPAAERAVRTAAPLAAEDAVLRIVHFYSLPSITAGPDVADAAAQIDTTFAHRESAYQTELARPGLSVEFHSARASPSRALLEMLDTGSYDLVALGQSQRVGIRGHTIGTVAESGVRHALCSALVAPPPLPLRGRRQ